MPRKVKPRFSLVPERAAEFAALTDAQVLTEFNRAQADIKVAYTLIDAASDANDTHRAALLELALNGACKRSMALESECYARNLDPWNPAEGVQ